MSLGCSEICSAALFTSAQSYQISKFPIPSLPDAGDRHSLLSTTTPQSNSDIPPSRTCPPLPNPRQKWNELWHFNNGGCHRPGETEKRQSSPGTSATWLCPMYPEYCTLHLPLPPAHWTPLSSHPPSYNVHLHVFTFWGVGVPSQKPYPFHLLI